LIQIDAGARVGWLTIGKASLSGAVITGGTKQNLYGVYMPTRSK
jgi:hypothetical protein